MAKQRLLVFLNDTGKFAVEPEEAVPEYLDPVDKIVGYASDKMLSLGLGDVTWANC